MTIRTSTRRKPAKLFGSSAEGKIQEHSCALILADHEIATMMIMRLKASTVLMVSGLPAAFWNNRMPLLAKHFTVVAVDLRGIGGEMLKKHVLRRRRRSQL